jgi:hypothetical protein
MGQVVKLNEVVAVPCGNYSGVLVIRDWSPLEPGAEEFKYCAPGVGLVLEAAGDDRSSWCG